MFALRFLVAVALLAASGARAAEVGPLEPAARELSDCYPTPGAGRVACYDRPSWFGFLLQIPGDIGGVARDSVRVENLPWTGGVLASTVGLMLFDQKLSGDAHQLGRWAHISSDGKTRNLASWLPIPYPTDVGSGIYYFGDGMLPVAITVGMLGYGLWSSDTRVLQTTSHLTEGLVSVGIVTQALKHISGRQSPSRSTQDGGSWRPVPNPLVYQKNVPAYDAFPSGHMATAMVTVTVLAADYPEYWLIRPIGYAAMGLLGFQMMNNDVHWASDYPLALALGYGLGQHAVSHGRRVVDADGPAPEGRSRRAEPTTVQVVPVPFQGGGGLAVVGAF